MKRTILLETALCAVASLLTACSGNVKATSDPGETAPPTATVEPDLDGVAVLDKFFNLAILSSAWTAEHFLPVRLRPLPPSHPLDLHTPIRRIFSQSGRRLPSGMTSL